MAQRETALIPLTRGYVAMVSPEDRDRVVRFKWQASVSRRGVVYAVRKIKKGDKRKRITMHGFIAGFDRADHKDRNTLNNQRENLRPSTRSQNAMNQRKQLAPGDLSSAYKGVSWKAGAHRKWCARITIGGCTRHIGFFRREVDAAIAYDDTAAVLFGEYAVPNFDAVYRDSLRAWEAEGGAA